MVAVITKRGTVRLTQVEKFVSGGRRTIRGLATAGIEDRVGDIVMPRGGQIKLPVPLLFQHDHSRPIGVVKEATITAGGIRITAELVEGTADADMVWTLIEARALDSYSIGFRPLESEPLPTGGRRFTKWELLEISVVSVPALPAAKIERGAVRLLSTRGSVPLVSAGGRHA